MNYLFKGIFYRVSFEPFAILEQCHTNWIVIPTGLPGRPGSSSLPPKKQTKKHKHNETNIKIINNNNNNNNKQ